MKLLIALAALILALPESGFRPPQNEAQQPPAAQQGEPSSSQQQPPSGEAKPANPPAEAQPSQSQSSAPQKPSTPKPKPPKKKKTAHSSTAKEPSKVIVRNGGARESAAQISPAMSKDQQQRQRDNTAQLLSTTDANLKKIESRRLTANQQGMARHIRTYMQQSKAASEAGDLERANTLALKAHLLSDDLLRR
jgi:outer membrane biosynthesis protein TonB